MFIFLSKNKKHYFLFLWNKEETLMSIVHNSMWLCKYFCIAWLYFVWIWIQLKVTFCVLCFKFFFFPTGRGQEHCLALLSTVHTLFSTVHRLKKIKMGPTVLFTHLKIILLQFFQFSIFNFSKNKLYPNGPFMWKWIKSLLNENLNKLNFYL